MAAWFNALIFLQGGGSGDAEGLVCCLGVFIGLIMVVVLSVRAAANADKARREALQAALNAYQESLARLKADPTNASLKQKTLELGRAYSNLTRNKSGVTVYDEVAISNDINAACAAATARTQASPAPAQGSVEERLAKLAELRDRV